MTLSGPYPLSGMMRDALPRVASTLMSSSGPSVVLLAGAGVSCSSGIPDFRSPGGMYDTLKPELLTATSAQRRMMSAEPTAVVSWELFQQNQLPYLELRRPFIISSNKQPPDHKPTLYHFFAALLHKKGLLIRSYTQNIDGLDHHTPLPKDKVIAVHGSMTCMSCEGCGAGYDSEEFGRELARNIKNIYDPSDGPKESTPIPCKSCGKPLTKPSTVLYGRNLPAAFNDNVERDTAAAQLVLIAGTSLTVYPAAALPDYAKKDCLRVVVDANYVEGSLDYERNEHDGIIMGDIDSVVLDIVDRCGWMPDMLEFRDEMCGKSRTLLDGWAAVKKPKR